VCFGDGEHINIGSGKDFDGDKVALIHATALCFNSDKQIVIIIKFSSLLLFSALELEHQFESQEGKRNKQILLFEWNRSEVLKIVESSDEFQAISSPLDLTVDFDGLNSKYSHKIRIHAKIAFLELKLSQIFRHHQDEKSFLGWTLDSQNCHPGYSDLPNKDATFQDASLASSDDSLRSSDLCRPSRLEFSSHSTTRRLKAVAL